MRNLRMLTLYAGPDRVVQAGATARFEEDEAAALVAGRYAVDADPQPSLPAPSAPPVDVVDLEDPAVAARAAELGKLTVPGLKDHADEHDISLPPDGKKADLVAAIIAAEQQAAAPPEE
ncbi:hypothetical protein OG216_25960 [Streptomycetaceae bacterium NBC_01309]